MQSEQVATSFPCTPFNLHIPHARVKPKKNVGPTIPPFPIARNDLPNNFFNKKNLKIIDFLLLKP